jgi:hypothetical protein
MAEFKSSSQRAFLVAVFFALTGASSAPGTLEHSVLAAHNAERAALGLPPLSWSTELARGARQWSEHLATTGRFEHSPDMPGDPPLGENIWGGTPGAYRPERMVSAWIAEKKFFRYGVFPANSTTGDVRDVSHYTQVIWRSSRKVGCAIARSDREEILVCRYDAPGNIIGSSPV